MWLERRVGRAAEVLVLEAWTAMAAGRLEVARAAVSPDLADAVPALLQHTWIEVLLIKAEAELHADNVTAGLADLDAALLIGEAVDVLRPFALPACAPAISSRRDWPLAGARPFAKKLAAAFAAISARPRGAAERGRRQPCSRCSRRCSTPMRSPPSWSSP